MPSVSSYRPARASTKRSLAEPHDRIVSVVRKPVNGTSGPKLTSSHLRGQSTSKPTTAPWYFHVPEWPDLANVLRMRNRRSPPRNHRSDRESVPAESCHRTGVRGSTLAGSCSFRSAGSIRCARWDGVNMRILHRPHKLVVGRARAALQEYGAQGELERPRTLRPDLVRRTLRALSFIDIIDYR